LEGILGFEINMKDMKGPFEVLSSSQECSSDSAQKDPEDPRSQTSQTSGPMVEVMRFASVSHGRNSGERGHCGHAPLC